MLGVVYSSRYTSLLSSPMYSKATDTLDEFIQNGTSTNQHNIYYYKSSTSIDYLWITSSSLSYYSDLNHSDVSNYRELYNRIRLTSSEVTEAKAMINNPRYSTFVDVLFDSFVTNTRQLFLLNITDLPFRCMHSCIYNHYGTVAMRRHSPYLEVVNSVIYR